MKVDLADAKYLGDLDARGREHGKRVRELTEEYHVKFREVCRRHGLDPDATGIDFDTGEVHSRVN